MFSSRDTWGDCLRSENSFDLVRLTLAYLVVVEHSFFLIDNSVVRDPLYVLTRGQIDFGQFAVAMFFAISGFLVTDSFRRSPTVGSYLAKRAARIVPGFLVACAIGLLALAPMVATGPGFFGAQRWDVAVANVLTLHQPGVNGILAGSQAPLIHGTLWSIRYEFDCYLLAAVLGAAGIFTRRGAATVVLVVAILLLAGLHLTGAQLPRWDTGALGLAASSPHKWPALVPFFLVGMLLQLWSSHLVRSRGAMVGAGVLLVACTAAGLAWAGLLVFGSYLTLAIALGQPRVHLALGGRPVDLSYGVYLYGWPVQQVLLHTTGRSLGPWELLALSVPIAAVVAFASWRLVEEPALRLVRRQRPVTGPVHAPA